MNSANAREEIFKAIREALKARGDEAARRGQVRARLEQPQPGIIPARARQPHGDLVALFQSKLEGAGAAVTRLENTDALPGAVVEVLRSLNAPLFIRCGNDPLFEGPAWDKAALLERGRGHARPDDLASLSHAVTGVAETGTLLLVSGPDNPSTLNFLPDTHVVAIFEQDIVGAYEHAWAKLRHIHGWRMPRTVNWISGPSRTADVEQTIVMGAHGPRRLFVFILGK